MATTDRPMADLYRALSPTERARLLARLVREDNMPELRRLADALPHDREARAAFRRAVHIVAELQVTLPFAHALLQGRVMECQGDLEMFFTARLHQRGITLSLVDLWHLLPYPITTREYQAIIAQERAELHPVAELAQYIAQCYWTEDAPCLCPAVSAWLTADATSDMDPEATTDADEDRLLDTATAEVQAILHAAIVAGALPATLPGPDGQPALPWGAFTDWLHRQEPTAYAPYGPEHHVAAVYLLRGLCARWDVRPDAELGAVQARRRDIVHTLGRLAGLSAEQLPDAVDPPTSPEERERQRATVEAAWPWQTPPREAAALQGLALLTSELCMEIHALCAGLETVCRQEFGGEDPLTPRLRAHVDDQRAAEQRLTARWASTTGPYLFGEDWPALPQPNPEQLQQLQDATVEWLTTM